MNCLEGQGIFYTLQLQKWQSQNLINKSQSVQEVAKFLTAAIQISWLRKENKY